MFLKNLLTKSDSGADLAHRLWFAKLNPGYSSVIKE